MMTATTSAATTHIRGLRMIVFMSSRVTRSKPPKRGGASWRGRACRYPARPALQDQALRPAGRPGQPRGGGQPRARPGDRSGSPGVTWAASHNAIRYRPHRPSAIDGAQRRPCRAGVQGGGASPSPASASNHYAYLAPNVLLAVAQTSAAQSPNRRRGTERPFAGARTNAAWGGVPPRDGALAE
jgi:hypothetical protein